MTEQDLTDWVKRQFGYPAVEVELSVAHYTDALDDAKRWFAQHVGGDRKQVLVSVQYGVGEVALPSYCEVVAAVTFDDPDDQGNLDDDEWLHGSMRTKQPGGRYQHSAKEQLLQYREMARKIAGTDPVWEHDRARQMLIVGPADATRTMLVEYSDGLIDVTKLSPTEYRLVREWTYAHAMYVLSMIRTKFSSLPSAGGEMTLNGDTLMSEANQRKSELEVKIQSLRTRRPDSMLVG